MTRFARAKGSKSSNERAPEESTPWEVMKEQLLEAKKHSEDAKKREEAEQQRITNYENFLKEQKVQKRKAEWCDFPEAQNGSANLNKKKKKENLNKSDISIDKTKKTEESEYEISKQAPSGKNKKKQKQGNEVNHEQTLESTQDITKANQSKKKKKSKITSATLPDTDNDQPQQTENKQKKKKQKSNKNNASDKEPDNGEPAESIIKQNKDQNDSPKQKQKAKKNKKTASVYNNNNSEPSRRKPIQERSFQLIINGKDVELVRYDGFPIMKKDADRLEELKTNMVKKGIPKSEVQRTMKLERRRAEKALARVKRDVCYNCRKGGHNLSDCPDLKTKIPGVGAADGMCFKCGSTEHRQFECKVQKDKEFRFATCFICKEPGHIARQCPDNPKGLYPNGGSCKLCGDVTHLRKDCPTVYDKKEEKSIKLQTLDSEENLEGIEQKSNNTFGGLQTKKPKKITF